MLLCVQGFLDKVCDILLKVKLRQHQGTPRNLCVVLMFDDVYLAKDISYDNAEDKIIGPHSRVNVMLLRGLFANYKIPIWYRYDHVLRKTEYLDIITKIENAGFHVVSSTCDMAKSNQSLATALGVTAETPYFENPCRPGSNIYWFFDPVHLVKLIRNHLIDQGFFLRGIEINWSLM